MTVKNRIAAIRLIEKLDCNNEYAEKIGVSFEIKKDKSHIVSPQALLWNDDRYYAPSHSEEKKRIVPYYNIHSSKNQRFFTYFSGNI